MLRGVEDVKVGTRPTVVGRNVHQREGHGQAWAGTFPAGHPARPGPWMTPERLVHLQTTVGNDAMMGGPRRKDEQPNFYGEPWMSVQVARLGTPSHS